MFFLLKFLSGKNRTLINKSESNNEFSSENNQSAFLKSLEIDAQERFQRRQENLKISNELKEKGNEKFKQNNFEKSIDYYSEVSNNLIGITIF